MSATNNGESSNDDDSSCTDSSDEESVDNGIADIDRLLLLQDPEIVTVRVSTGEAAEQWKIHQSLLTSRSPFFAAAMNGSFKEATTNTIELVEDDPAAFRYLVRWLYTGKPGIDLHHPLTAIHAWGLGEKLQCPTFQDHAMRQLIEYCRGEYFVEEMMRLVYEISPPDCKLRKFALHQVVWDRSNGYSDQIGAAGVMAVEDFNRDLLERLLNYDDKAEDPSVHVNRYMKKWEE
ncbi:MAG: hypothetical protein Q9168_004904 [Polycauliona sp. 1 TL-2023]